MPKENYDINCSGWEAMKMKLMAMNVLHGAWAIHHSTSCNLSQVFAVILMCMQVL